MDLASNPPLSHKDFTNKMTAVFSDYHHGKIDKGMAMWEAWELTDNQTQDFYGKVVDQYGKPVADAEVTANIELVRGAGGTQSTRTGANGLFQFTGLRGESLGITPQKNGFQIEGHGLGRKGQNGPETGPDNRAIFIMWKLKGPEPMIHDSKFYKVNSDGSESTIDFLNRKMISGTNAPGDLLVWVQRPAQIKPHENFEWSFGMTAIGGGFIEVTNDDYLNEAPTSGYEPQYTFNMTPANPKWRGWNGQETFYLKSRDGKVYGHFQIKINPVYRDGASLEIESYINPSGSRNLEFDPAKQIQ